MWTMGTMNNEDNGKWTTMWTMDNIVDNGQDVNTKFKLRK